MNVRTLTDKFSRSQLVTGMVVSGVLIFGTQAINLIRLWPVLKCDFSREQQACEAVVTGPSFFLENWALTVLNLVGIVLLILCIDGYQRRKK